MRLSTISEGLQTLYYVPMPGIEEELYDIPDAARSVRCWQDTPDSLNAMSEWLNVFVTYGDAIENGTWSLYQFVGPKPVSLPFVYTLNYVDMMKAEKVSPDQLEEFIQWLARTDPTSEMIVNSAYEGTQEEPKGMWTKGRTTHEELVKVLSDIVKTLGPLVWCPEDVNSVMRHQVIATIPFRMIKISPDSIHDRNRIPEILDPNSPNYDKRIIRKKDSDKEYGEYDSHQDDEPDSADWWKV